MDSRAKTTSWKIRNASRCHIASGERKEESAAAEMTGPFVERRKRTKQRRRGRCRRTATMRTRKGTRRNAVYALSVIGGRGERPSMWRTCCCCCCSLPVERAPADEHGARARNRSRRKSDSRHAKSPREVCERTGGFRWKSGRVSRRFLTDFSSGTSCVTSRDKSHTSLADAKLASLV